MKYYERIVGIKKSKYCVTESDILKLEQEFKVSLPQDYKNFLLKYNGGNTNKVFYINKNNCEKFEGFDSDFWDIDMFFEINAENDYWELKNRVRGLLLDLKYSLRPNWCLWAIALSCSRIFALSLNEEDYGAVYFIDTMAIEEELLYTKVEDTFTDFINNLIPDDIVVTPEKIFEDIETKYQNEPEKMNELIKEKMTHFKKMDDIEYIKIELKDN